MERLREKHADFQSRMVSPQLCDLLKQALQLSNSRAQERRALREREAALQAPPAASTARGEWRCLSCALA